MNSETLTDGLEIGEALQMNEGIVVLDFETTLNLAQARQGVQVPEI